MASYLGPVLLITAAILLIEIACGRHRGIYRKEDWLVIGLPAVLNPAVSRLLAGMLIGAVAGVVAPGGKGALAHLPLLPTYLALLLIVEFCFYWVHRWAHVGQRDPRLAWLWKIHRTHHAGKYMNVLVTLRINLAWSFVVPTAWLTGFAIYLGLGQVAALVILTIYGWNLITHSHFRWDDPIRAHPRFGRFMRAIEHVVISPGMHHTHHGYGKDGAPYRNYAVTFAFLDWMFGSLHIPEGRPAKYGLPGPEPHWAEEVFYPLVRTGSRVQSAIGIALATVVIATVLISRSASASGATMPAPPPWPAITQAPSGAPSVVLIMTDDVGFGASSTFGGPVATPTLDRLARTGVRYNMMHTTGICSPTRAALLTGRNHSAVGIGNVVDAATAYEGYNSVMPKSAASVARVLRDAGYSTAMFGKSHTIPSWQSGPAGPFDQWPTGLGFQHFYGFLGGDTNQFAPVLYDGTRPIDPSRDRDDYILDRDFADQAIGWMRQQRAAAPGKPLFVYFAPGTAHAPHHAPREWIDRYRGQFDQGWDDVRRQTLARQKKLGVVPANTQLADRFDPIPAWQELTAQQKKVYARQMEVYAGALSFADHEIGRVVDEARALLGPDTLVIYLQGDNGASAEAGLDGSLNEHGVLNGVNDSLDEMERRLDQMGGPMTYGHYSIGWANAMNTPFPLAKQLPSHLGAVRNGMVIDWPGRTSQPEAVRSQFAHVIDIMPTILDAARITLPRSVDGVEQQPLDGRSLLPTFSDPYAPEARGTQFFNIWDNMGLYHDGWWAGSVPSVYPWDFTRVLGQTIVDGRQWQLFDLRKDFSQSTDVAAKFPERLARMQQLYFDEAARANALPIHRYEGAAGRPSNYAGLDAVRFAGPQSRLPEEAAPSLIGRSFKLAAQVNVPAGGADGVLFAIGGRFGGLSWYVKDGRIAAHYNLADVKRFDVAAEQTLTPGEHLLELRFDTTGRGKPAEITLLADGAVIGKGSVERTLPFRYSLDETLDVGSDEGTPVTEAYASPFTYAGSLHSLTISFAPVPR